MSHIKPVGEMVLVKEIESDKVTQSGLILTTDLDRYVTKAEVIEVGPGELSKTGVRMTPEVAVGDIVWFSAYSGDTIIDDGEDLKLIREADILLKENS